MSTFIHSIFHSPKFVCNQVQRCLPCIASYCVLASVYIQLHVDQFITIDQAYNEVMLLRPFIFGPKYLFNMIWSLKPIHD